MHAKHTSAVGRRPARRRLRGSSLLLSILAGALTVLPGASVRAEADDRVRLSDLADLVVIGTPTAARSVSGTGGAPVDTVFTVEVDRAAKGRAGETVEVRVPGGQVASGEWLLLEHEPNVVVGEPALFYLTGRYDSAYQTARGEEGHVPAHVMTGAGLRANAAYEEFAGRPHEYRVVDDATTCDAQPPAETGYSGFVQLRHPTTGAGLTFSGRRYGFYWNTDTMRDWTAGMETAVSAWNGAGGTATAVNEGWVFNVPTEGANDGMNVVGWGQTTRTTALAQTWRWVHATEPLIVNADIVFDVDYRPQIQLVTDGSLPAADKYDFTSIAVHELGHVLGFGHITDSSMPMYGCLNTGTAKRSPLWGERAGHVNFYPPNTVGQYLVDEAGAVFALGGAGSYGQTNAFYYGGANQGNAINYPTHKARDIELYRPNRKGYWTLASNGGVFAFGAAPFKGSAVGAICGGCTTPAMASTPTGQGYWIVASDGGVFAFGDAPFRGSAVGLFPAGGYAVGIAARPDGQGYWVVNNYGQIYAFNAPYAGGGVPTGSQPARSIEPNTAGSGYWILGNDGGIFSFNSPFLGSAPGAPGVRHLSRHPSADLYQFVGTNGQTYQGTGLINTGRGTTSTAYAANAVTIRPPDAPPPPPADFWMTSSPTGMTVARGQQGSSTITLTANGTFPSSTVSLSTSGAPVGVTATLSASSRFLSAGTSQSVTLTVSVATTFVGTSPFRITVNGSGGGLTRSTFVDVTVPVV